ncbi:BBE domain-containing protein [Nocardiopsis ansamitocini]|uniref:FAD-linked oxidase n=1 Tax=Nocardiopsis ansamitocini TaxID=1670832 RepID=A0A9W6UJG8_9ACTN|nr:BBE domain-containing protein [Nocardiopsis ansamitocini]GLU48707.1 FAD-linked oxidase [Nocardiopsis ansamitocini]
MTDVQRRGFLTGALVGGAALGATAFAPAVAAQPVRSGAACGPVFGPVAITPDDPRYESLLGGHNYRFAGRPESVHMVGTTQQVVDAVTTAVAGGKRIVVRSGGHCFEDFTTSSDVQVVVDVSPMADVFYDKKVGAFAVGAGATLGHVYRTLFTGWGVTVPGGACFEVGAGGHVLGGGYGHLSRRYGLVADHLYAVEVVVVDETGRAGAVIATREENDPHRDLWWAHVGGGGGNFGVVTRFWLRTPGVNSSAPARLLPKAPARMRRHTIMWPWDDMDETSFTALFRDFCTWAEDNSAPDSPFTPLWSILLASHRSAGTMGMIAVIDDALPDAEALLAEHVEAVTARVGVTPVVDSRQVIAWLSPQNWPEEPGGRYKHKAAELRKGYTSAQIAAIWRHLSDGDYTNPAAHLSLAGYGGQVNAVSATASAVAQRDSILKAVYSTGNWQDADEDDTHIAWLRDFYRDVYAETGGVPVPGEVNAGCYINYPDIDVADPDWNTSGVSWPQIYYNDNYPRLQKIKKRYDPGNVFRHAMSIRLP